MSTTRREICCHSEMFLPIDKAEMQTEQDDEREKDQGQFKKTERQWPLATGLEKVSFHSNPKERQCFL